MYTITKHDLTGKTYISLCLLNPIPITQPAVVSTKVPWCALVSTFNSLTFPYNKEMCRLSKLRMTLLACFIVVCWFFFKINFLVKFFQEYHQSVKQFGSRSGPTLCRAWSGSNCLRRLSAEMALVGKELRINEVLYVKGRSGMANYVNRDQTAPSGVVPSEFTLFSQTWWAIFWVCVAYYFWRTGCQ